MTVLILGASGFVGKRVREELKKEYVVYGTYHTPSKEYAEDKWMKQCEVDEPEQLEMLLDTTNPDLVISSLRGEFSLQLEAHNVIADYLAKDSSKKMIFISTANVFDGALEKVHYENDVPIADSDYGKYKIECENLLKSKLGKNCIILRLPCVWGTNAPRLQHMKQCINEKIAIKSYQNVVMNFTTDQQIAKWILYIIENELDGIFHIGTTDICDYHEFEELLRKKLGLPTPIYDIETSEEKIYQAVVPTRKEIPSSLMMTIDDIVTSIS